MAGLYKHQLAEIRLAMFYTAKNQTSHDMSYAGADALLAYWVGVARYALSESALNSELKNIKQFAQNFDIAYPESIRTIDDIYPDVGKSTNRIVGADAPTNW